tara:strand:+ start:64 stop:576 length:513 start_codon:yes stop_codon:yes gene_type:complete
MPLTAARKQGGTVPFAVAAALILSACGPAGEAGNMTGDNGGPEQASPEAPAMASPVAAMSESEDALVPGTEYNATTEIACGFNGNAPDRSCPAGVKRQWGEDGTTLVEVAKPDGFKRAIFFRGTTPYGADSAEADGSAGWDLESSRKGDQVTVTFGPETYVIVDALVEGG